MKRLIILALLFASCKKQSVQPSSQVKDCNCDRVVEKHKFNMVGNQPGQVIYFGDYITINKAGIYAINVSYNSTSPSTQAGLSKNYASTNYLYDSTVSNFFAYNSDSPQYLTLNYTGRFAVNDVIRFHISYGSAAATINVPASWRFHVYFIH